MMAGVTGGAWVSSSMRYEKTSIKSGLLDVAISVSTALLPLSVKTETTRKSALW